MMDEAMLPFASWPLGATLPDSARRKPSEIPSQTRSVSAFLPGRVSVGPRSFGQFRSRQHGFGGYSVNMLRDAALAI